jgi:hypothetical protein
VPTSPPSIPVDPRDRGPLRLRLSDTVSPDGLRGAWWPRSRDLRTEGRDLVDHFPHSAGYIERLLFSRPDWDDGVAPDGHGLRRIMTDRGPVKIGSFPGDDTQLMVLSMATGRRIKLTVIPSDTHDELGETLLSAAGPSRSRP